MGLSTLSTDTASQLDVLGHDGDTLGVDGAEVSVLKQTNQVSLACLLKGHDGRPLVSPDLTETHGTRSVPMGLLHPPSGRSGLSGSFTSSGFTCGLLGTSHGVLVIPC